MKDGSTFKALERDREHIRRRQVAWIAALIPTVLNDVRIARTVLEHSLNKVLHVQLLPQNRVANVHLSKHLVVIGRVLRL